jgi:hypothetical protein
MLTYADLIEYKIKLDKSFRYFADEGQKTLLVLLNDWLHVGANGNSPYLSDPSKKKECKISLLI